MHEFAFSSTLGLKADSRAARLKRFAIRAGRNLAEFPARGKPNFQIVSLRGGKTHVSRAEQDRAVMQAELLENGFRIPRQGFVLFVTFLRMRELEELDFLKLMLPQDAPRILSGCSSLGAETRSPCRDANRQFFFGDGFIAVEIVQLHFSRRCQPKVRVLKVEEIGCELRQLAGAHERSGVHQERRENLRVAMLARVDVQKEISEGPLEPCAPSLVHGEPRSGNLRGRRQIQNPGPLPNFPMRLWLE